MPMEDKEKTVSPVCRDDRDKKEQPPMTPPIIEEIKIEELAVDGICGIY